MTTTKQSGGLPERHKAHLSRPPKLIKFLAKLNQQKIYPYMLLTNRRAFQSHSPGVATPRHFKN